MKRSLLLSLLATACVSLPSCSSNGMSPIDVSKCPDYSNDEHFSFYAYTPPGNGYYTIDGYDYPGKVDETGAVVSFQTKEKYQEYKDCGFDTILIQADDAYCGEEWETSHMKFLMDLAEEVGLKAIIFDNRIYVLSNKETPIVGPDCSYKSQEELEDYISFCSKDYKNHPAFHGLLIKDEPSYRNFPAIGSLFRAVKKVLPNAFLQCNLFPLSPGNYAAYAEGATAGTVISAYRSYLEQFLAQTGSSYIMADSYPMKLQNGYNRLDSNHIKTVQMLQEAAMQYGASVYAVAQSSAWKNNGIPKARDCTEADMRWQTNLYMGMGVKQISYFTYQTKKTNSTGGVYFKDGASFSKWNGDKTPLYDWMQGIHKEMQQEAPAVLSFDYQGVRYYKEGSPDVSFMSGVDTIDSLKAVSNVKVSNNSVALVSEMIDKTSNRNMYMFMNPSDPSSVTSPCTVSFSLCQGNAISVYSKGEHKGYKISGGNASFSLNPGEAVFVIPFNL